MIHEHTIFMDTVQAIIEGFALIVALIQATKIHLPSLLSDEANEKS